MDHFTAAKFSIPSPRLAYTTLVKLFSDTYTAIIVRPEVNLTVFALNVSK
jgi:hypothetical protein